MPEHVHLLISEPRKGTPSTAMQILKQKVSREVRRRRRRAAPAGQLALDFGEGPAALAQFWQRRFHDFNVWSAKKRSEKLEYMHMNPVERGLTTRPRDWVWSSAGAYEGRGEVLLAIDFEW